MLNPSVMQQFRLLALGALLGTVSLTPIASADELPACEPSLKAKRVASPLVLTEECPFQGKVIVSFRVKANGRTTNIVIETVRGDQGKAPKYCVSDYARAFVQGFRFPKRDADCQHVMAFSFSDKN